MAFGLGGLEDLIGINRTAGNKEIQAAIDALQSVNVPNLAELTLPQLQQYVKAGVLTPAQYQAIAVNPDVYRQTIQQTQDLTGKNAQSAALQQLGNIVQQGGSTEINRANLLNNLNQTNQAMQAARQGIEQNAQERGVAGGGLEFIDKLMNEQSNAQNANLGATNAAANNAQLALQALANQGTLGSTMQGQSNALAQAQAEAARQIAEYNSQLQSQANQYNVQNANAAQAANLENAQNIANANTGLANQRTMYNAALPETIFQNQMQKAGGLAGQYGNMANLEQQHAQNQNQFIGNLIGTGAKLGTAYATGGASLAAPGGMPGTNASDYTNLPNPGPTGSNPYDYTKLKYAHGGMVNCYAQGGEVHDHSICMMAGGGVAGDAPVDGDSEQNDIVDAKLSPGEIVLPRSVSQTPDAPEKAAQFVSQVKGQNPYGATVGSFADALKILEQNGLELRLSCKESI